MKKEKFIVSESLIGKYINQYLWSDVNHAPVAVLVHNQPGVGPRRIPHEPRVIEEQHLMAVVLNRTPAHQPLRRRALLPSRRGLAYL